MSRYWKLLIGIVIPLLTLWLPTDAVGAALHLDGLTLVQHRVLAIFLFAVLFWVLEPIPVFATSVSIIVLELVLISNRAAKPFAFDGNGDLHSGLINYKAIMGTFASPIILLFLGGFFLAMAATKYRLDTNLARVMLKPFGTQPRYVLLGLMGITAVFSMFMSNTATTAMMLTILVPVLKNLPRNDRGSTAFVLGIPFAANIGGMGTPIGTPPNAVAQKYLTSGVALADGATADWSISFGGWMLFAVPYVIIMLTVAWALLLMLYPVETEEIKVSMRGKFLRTREAIVVYITFAATIILWLCGSSLHNMTSHIVAMIPVAIFCATGIVTREDLKTMSWDVLWLVSGGVALGLALGTTGLSEVLVATIPFQEMGLVAIVIAAALLGTLMSTFMSNTATANLMLPIMAALGVSLAASGSKTGMVLILGVTFACSLAMAMPISTPPNALAHATRYVNTGDLARSGVIIGVVGILLTFGMLWIMNASSFFS